ncbi:hypothetical protein [Elioraea sp.]|uniref:hypothetical protein n=1 Tax=Elioraea sp. TaxID=2185103 RepID=UPI0021DF0FAB|nr:hypothetical protein [Elioraea sp.]GIX10983.1 MAG: hypothetical protein KatS3mg116_2693 [Elioraea sp.]
MAAADAHCPPPVGLTAAGLLTLLGLGGRGEDVRRRLARALHARAPAAWPLRDEGAPGFGERLLAFLATAEGDAAFAAAAAELESALAPAERRLDLLAAARRAALKALEEAAPAHAARLRAAHRPGAPPPLALAAAAAEVALWSEAALILWRLAAASDQAEEAAMLAARYPALADALPGLARQAPPAGRAGSARERERLLRLVGLAEDAGGASLLPPAAELEMRIDALAPERIQTLPAGWREALRRRTAAEVLHIAEALGAYERASLAVEARETALREAALQSKLDVVAVEAALTKMREAEGSLERTWRAVVEAIGGLR